MILDLNTSNKFQELIYNARISRELDNKWS